jgi:hypothetical protein
MTADDQLIEFVAACITLVALALAMWFFWF